MSLASGERSAGRLRGDVDAVEVIMRRGGQGLRERMAHVELTWSG